MLINHCDDHMQIHGLLVQQLQLITDYEPYNSNTYHMFALIT